MNRERILELADHIERQQHNNSMVIGDGFTMRTFTRKCGTPGCIAGWAAFLWGGNYDEFQVEVWEDTVPICAMGAGVLGLPTEWASSVLFGPNLSDYALVSPSIAATALRNLANSSKDLDEIGIVNLWPEELLP